MSSKEITRRVKILEKKVEGRDMEKKTLLPLNTESVNINTASITIRTLTIGKRQVTLSVFRQLPEAEMVDTLSVQLLGIPWGHMNYWWGDINPNLTHFIFQKGDKLYRCPFLVEDSPCTHPDGIKLLRDRFREECVAAFCAKILEGWRPSPSRRDRYGRISWDMTFRCDEICFLESDWRGSVAHICGPEDACYERGKMLGLLLEVGPIGRTSIEERNSNILDKLRKEVVYRVGSPLSFAQISERMEEIKRQAIDFNRRWDALMEQLRGVEQLFIAV